MILTSIYCNFLSFVSDIGFRRNYIILIVFVKAFNLSSKATVD